jgi:hypothetical protein
MVARAACVVVLCLLLLPVPAAADAGVPLAWLTLPLIPLIVAVEVAVFLLLAKLRRAAVPAKRVILAVLIANVASSAVGVPLHALFGAQLGTVGRWVAVTFLVSIVVEWVAYVLFFTGDVRPGLLLAIVVTANVCSYLAFSRVAMQPALQTGSGAPGELRAVASAESAYESMSGGWFGPLECLAAPERCLPAETGAARLLDSVSVSKPTRYGYVFTFVAGRPDPKAPTSPGPGSALLGFAYYAVPAEATGGERRLRRLFRLPTQDVGRSFCIDETAVIRVLPGGQSPDVLTYPCPRSWAPLR